MTHQARRRRRCVRSRRRTSSKGRSSTAGRITSTSSRRRRWRCRASSISSPFTRPRRTPPRCRTSIAAPPRPADQQGHVVVTKRMGGGFGGKECQATHPAAIAALVAHKTQAARRASPTTKTTTCASPAAAIRSRTTTRSRFDDDGVITAAQIDFFSDGGAFADLSHVRARARDARTPTTPTTCRTSLIRGTVCRTNYPPNTAFRGFGGPQGVATIENILEEIAVLLKIDPLDVRRRNCYGIDDRNVTPYGQVVRNNMLPRLFDEIAERGDYRDRVAEVARRSTRRRATHLRGHRLHGGEVRHLVQHEVPQPGQRAGQRLPRRLACRSRPARRRWGRA